jgi:hypothetical protein
MGGGGESRTANSDRGLVFSVGGLGKLDCGLGRGETFFHDSNSDRDSDETFQISRKLGHEHVEFFCLLDSQLCSIVVILTLFKTSGLQAPDYSGVNNLQVPD